MTAQASMTESAPLLLPDGALSMNLPGIGEIVVGEHEIDRYSKIAGYRVSVYQAAVCVAAERGTGNLIVNAVAGSGKTTLLMLLAQVLYGTKGFFAFGKDIKRVIEEKLRALNVSQAEVKTIHSACWGPLNKHLRARNGFGIKQGDPDERKYQKFCRAVVEEFVQTATYMDADEPPTPADLAMALSSLIDMARLNIVNPNDLPGLRGIARKYELDIFFDELYGTVAGIIKAGEEQAIREGVIDFTDMPWLVYRWDIKPWGYSWVFVDECLPYKTPVHLADGSAMEIGHIVENRLPVEVLAYDTATGQQRACKVTGWSKTLNQKPLVKIKVQWNERHPSHRNHPTNFVVCTTDHKVWANGEWVYAGEVTPGMVMQVETAAHKAQAYKITSSGKATLSDVMGKKNQSLDRSLLTNGRISVRGGNGHGPTLPQRVLAEALGEDWEVEYILPTRQGRGSGYPNHYKLDIANPELGIAVEVDGGSHNNHARREQDRKKEQLLERIGWQVVRIANRDAIQSTAACVDRIQRAAACPDGVHCPIDATVVSVEPVSLPDYHVYDITVEGCHNFYANGILVHNCQDLSPLGQEVVGRLRFGRAARMIYVGDPAQAIFSFAGADARSFQTIKERYNATELPLSICYRCPSSHLELAQRYVPHIQPRPNAASGTIIEAHPDDLLSIVQNGDIILGRFTAPLISLCMRLIASHRPARVKGRDVLKRLKVILTEDLPKVPNYSFLGFRAALAHYEAVQLKNLELKDATDSAIRNFQDRIAGLRACYDGLGFGDRHAAILAGRSNADPGTEWDLYREIDQLFSDERAAIWLSTVHRFKGGEGARIVVLEHSAWPYRFPRQTPDEAEQERNLAYVSLTRSTDTMILVDERHRKMSSRG